MGQNNIVHAFCHRKPSKYNILFLSQSQIQKQTKKSTPTKTSTNSRVTQVKRLKQVYE